MGRLPRILALWAVVGLTLVWIFNIFGSAQARPEPQVPFSDFLAQVRHNQISGVVIEGNTIHARTVTREHFKTYAPLRDSELVKFLLSRNVHISATPDQGDVWTNATFKVWLPMLLLAAVWIFAVRQMNSGDQQTKSSNPWK
jgi:cell division protease FtsH